MPDVNSIQTTCVVCESPLTRAQGLRGYLCDSPACHWKLNAMPAHLRCDVCGRPLSATEVAQRTCARHDCQVEGLVRRPLAMRRQRYQERVAEVTRWRDEIGAAEGIAEPDAYVVTPFPLNHGKAGPLASARIDKHRAHLERAIGMALEQRALGAVPAEPPSVRPVLPPRTPAMTAALHAACAACRGLCCSTGGEHAYITSFTMHRYLDQHPDATMEQIVDAYLAWLPAESLTNGCVYQHEHGCVLPSEMRSRTCGEFYCAPLTQLQLQRSPDQPLRAFFAPDDDGVFREGVFAGPEGIRTVRRYQTDTPASLSEAGDELPDGGDVAQGHAEAH